MGLKKYIVIFLLLLGFSSNATLAYIALDSTHHLSIVKQSGQNFLVLKHHSHSHSHEHVSHSHAFSHHDHFIQLPDSEPTALTVNEINKSYKQIDFKSLGCLGLESNLISSLIISNSMPSRDPPPLADQTLSILKTIRLLA